MLIPVSMHKDLITGKTEFTYAEAPVEVLTDILVSQFNKMHPDANIRRIPIRLKQEATP